MDACDRATELEEQQRAQALANRPQSICHPSHNCIECGLEIPSARQVATGGTEYCVECAGRVGR